MATVFVLIFILSILFRDYFFLDTEKGYIL